MMSDLEFWFCMGILVLGYIIIAKIAYDWGYQDRGWDIKRKELGLDG